LQENVIITLSTPLYKNTWKSVFVRRRRFKVFCQAFFQKSLRIWAAPNHHFKQKTP